MRVRPKRLHGTTSEPLIARGQHFCFGRRAEAAPDGGSLGYTPEPSTATPRSCRQDRAKTFCAIVHRREKRRSGFRIDIARDSRAMVSPGADVGKRDFGAPRYRALQVSMRDLQAGSTT